MLRPRLVAPQVPSAMPREWPSMSGFMQSSSQPRRVVNIEMESSACASGIEEGSCKLGHRGETTLSLMETHWAEASFRQSQPWKAIMCGAEPQGLVYLDISRQNHGPGPGWKTWGKIRGFWLWQLAPLLLAGALLPISLVVDGVLDTDIAMIPPLFLVFCFLSFLGVDRSLPPA